MAKIFIVNFDFESLRVTEKKHTMFHARSASLSTRIRCHVGRPLLKTSLKIASMTNWIPDIFHFYRAEAKAAHMHMHRPVHGMAIGTKTKRQPHSKMFHASLYSLLVVWAIRRCVAHTKWLRPIKIGKLLSVPHILQHQKYF